VLRQLQPRTRWRATPACWCTRPATAAPPGRRGEHVSAHDAHVESIAVFDSRTGSNHRFVQLSLSPGSRCPAWRCRQLTEFWVRGGLLRINGQVAHANCFVVIEPGAEVDMASPFGVLMLAWAEGPETWVDPESIGRARAQRSSLFGF
jgi:hypothetical protein